MAIKVDFKGLIIKLPGGGGNWTLSKCMNGGPNHKHSLSCKLFTTEMTRQDLVDLIARKGYDAEVEEEEGSGFVRVITKSDLPQHVKEAIEASMPVAVLVRYVIRTNETCKVAGLEKWMKATKKYLPTAL